MGKFLHSFFSPLGFRRAVPQVWDGFQTNIKLMVIAEVLVLIFALAVAIIRGLPGRGTFPLRAFAVGYTDFFRGTPLILVAYVWGLGIPALHIAVISDQSLFTYGIIALTLVYTAYVTEVYRAGIESVHPSQRMAARSLGLTYAQTMRHVVLPQALRMSFAPTVGFLVQLIKGTSLAAIIGFVELSRSGQLVSSITYKPLLAFGLVAVCYFAICFPLSRYSARLERRLAVAR